MEQWLNTSLVEPGRNITLVIPTLEAALGESVGRVAQATAGCSVPVEVIVSHDQRHEGFSKTVNRGMSLVDSGDICLLNDDIYLFPYGWLEILRRVLYSDPTYGIAGPSGWCGSAPMKKGRPGDTGVQVVPQLSFWCVLMKRRMLDDLGFLDEKLIHYCSDNWYCRVMREADWKCVWAAPVFLGHKAHGSGIPRDWRDHDREVYQRLLKGLNA